jgi:hypothetical protein
VAAITLMLGISVTSAAPPAAARAARSTMSQAIGATEILHRAQYWQKNPPPGGYSWYATWRDPQGTAYRTDCSGYVSMALHLPAPGLMTSDIGTSSDFVKLSRRSQLQPGDIIDAPGFGDGGHAVLFAGWIAGTGKSYYMGYEFGTGNAPAYRRIPYPYFNDGRVYYPYHYKKMVTEAGIGVFRLSDGTFHLDSDRDGKGERALGHAAKEDLPVAGDWTGSGRAGVGVFRSSRRVFLLDTNLDGRTDRVVHFGNSGDLPLAGKWTRSGHDGIGVFHPATGSFYLDTDLDGHADKKVSFGLPGDRPIAGDWTGSGRDGIAVFRPSTGVFYFDTDLDGRVDKIVRYGTLGDHPIAADWTGSGHAGIGVFRPSTGTFYLDTDLDGRTDKWIRYGSAGDRPVS